MNELALFAGAGGGILGGHLLGWRTVCAVERDAYAAGVLAQRQNDGVLAPFPIWSDVTTFDGRPWSGIVDIVSGGFPCQDISAAGKGAGIDGERSGLWREMARIVCEVRPQYVYVENSPMLTSRGLGIVLGDLAALGFDAQWGVLSAADVGAPHERERIWILANACSDRCRIRSVQSKRELWSSDAPDAGENGEVRFVANSDRDARQQRRANHTEEVEGRRHIDRSDFAKDNMANATRIQQRRRPEQRTERKRTGTSGKPIDIPDPECVGCEQMEQSIGSRAQGEGAAGKAQSSAASWWKFEPDVGRVADGVAFRVDRLKALGNGQVPAVAATSFNMLAAAEIGKAMGE